MACFSGTVSSRSWRVCGLVVISALTGGACASTSARDAAPSGGIETTPASCRGEPDAPACEPPVDVMSPEEVYAQIAALHEATDTTATPSSGALLLPSRDLRAQTSIDLDVIKLRAALTAACAPDAGIVRCTEPTFTPEKPFHTSHSTLADFDAFRLGSAYPTGVTCRTSAVPGECSVLTVAAGTTLRFQRVVERNDYAHGMAHYVRVVRPCAAACADGEVRCAASKTCVVAGKDYCVLCGGLEPKICACREACSPMGEGTMCRYWSSDDTFGRGACRGGACAL